MRPVRVHVEVDDDPVAVAERVAVGVRRGRRRAPALRHLHVDVLELLGEPIEVCGLGLRARCRPAALAGARRPRRAARPRRRELGLARRARPARRSRTRWTAPRAAAGRCRPGPGRRSPPRRASRGAHRASRATACAPGREPRPGSSAAGSAVPCARARPPSPAACGKSRSTDLATALWPGASSTTIRFRFAAGAKTAVSTPSGIVVVVAREPLGRALDRLVGRPEQRVDAGEELRALVLARRDGDPLGGDERGRRRRLGLEQRRRGEARQAGLEAVDDVERSRSRAWPRGSRERPSAARHARSTRWERRRRSRRRRRPRLVAAPAGPRGGRRRATTARRSSPCGRAGAAPPPLRARAR